MQATVYMCIVAFFKIVTVCRSDQERKQYMSLAVLNATAYIF